MSLEGEGNGLERGDGASSGGLEHRADIGVEGRPPGGAEAAGDLAEGDAGAQGALGFVVGGRERPVGDEEEEVAPGLGDDALELGARGMGGGPLEELAELLDELAPAGREPLVAEAVADAAEAAGAPQEREQPGGEAGIAGVERMTRASRIRCARQNWWRFPAKPFCPP